MKPLREIVGIVENDDEDEDEANFRERINHHETEADKHKVGSRLETLHSNAASAWRAAHKYHQKGHHSLSDSHVQAARNYEDEIG